MPNPALLKRFNIPENTPEQDLIPLLITKEKEIIQRFFQDIPVNWKNNPSATFPVYYHAFYYDRTHSMDLYYKYRTDSNEIREVLKERRTDVNRTFITPYDHYQLLRNVHCKETLDESKQYANQLGELSSLGELFAEAQPKIMRDTDTYYLQSLIQVSSLLNSFLSQHYEKNSKFAISFLINRIDAVNRLFANYLLNLILNKQVDEKKELLKELFKNIDAQDQEVIPWLNVFFKDQILNSDFDRNLLIDEYIKLVKIKNPSPVNSFFQKLFGVNPDMVPSLDELLPSILKLEGNLWYEIESQELELRLKKIETYLLNSYISDGVMHNICLNLIREFKAQPKNQELARVLYLCCRQVYQKQHYLEQTKDYLNIINREIENKKIPVPAVTLAAIDNEKATANKAFELKMIPPSARTIYEMVKNEAQFIELAKLYDKPALIKLFNCIFIDDSLLEQHLTFFNSGFLQQIGLNEGDFPLMMLRKHYTEPNSVQNPIPLWEALLDSGIIMSSSFLAFAKNEELFAALKPIAKEFNNRNKIFQHPQRYKELCLALSVYCTLHTEVITGEQNLAPKLQRDSSVFWANELFMQITQILPQNADQKFDLQKAFEIADITMSPPNPTDLSIQKLAKSIPTTLLQNHTPGQNLSYAKELIRGCMLNYLKENRHSLTEEERNKVNLFHLVHIPTSVWAVCDIVKQTYSIALPEFLSHHQKVKLENAVLLAESKKRVFDPQKAIALFCGLRQNGSDTTEENISKDEIFLFAQSYLKYCQEQLAKNSFLEPDHKLAYTNYIQFWTNPIVAKICNTFGKIGNCIKNDTSKKDFFTKLESDWNELQQKMSSCFLNLTHVTEVQKVMFSTSNFISSHPDKYGRMAEDLFNDLKSLETFAKSKRPETASQYDEIKCNNAFKIIKKQCDLYKKHLKVIAQEKVNEHNAKRVERAKKKLDDFRTITQFENSPLASESLKLFNHDFAQYKEKYAQPSLESEQDKIEKRFWKRIAYALFSVGIYAIIRGMELGSLHFWKSHRVVIEDRLNDVMPLIETDCKIR